MHQDDASMTADYVIVGAGSAGCVLANRLSENGRHRVILIEAGGDDRPLHDLRAFYDLLNIHIPAGFTRVYRRPNLTWGYMSDAEPGLARRSVPVPRGKILGGSSSINGMIYARGLSSDFDHWRHSGCVGWSFDDVLPFFRKSEHCETGAESHHGRDGPLTIGVSPLRHPLSAAMIAAIEEAGLGRTDDMNGPHPEGGTHTPLTLRRGLRQSAAVAFLHPALKRPNLHVETHATTEAVIFERGRAVGVRISKGSRRQIIRANREVILSAGAINSPKLLQLSGIGPAALLASHGIEVHIDSPNVGAGLQDHLSLLTRSRLKPGTGSMNEQSRGLRLAAHLARFVAARRGLLTIGGAHVTGYVRSRPELDMPDVQLFSSPATADVQRTMAAKSMVMEREPGITLNAYRCRPLSRGHVRIRSADPAVAPGILHNYLSDPADQRTAIDSLRMIRRIFSQPAIAGFVDHEITPGPERQGDDALLAFARETGSTSFHEAGSVAMGGTPDKPIDPALRVRGVDGLRVVDASVMPSIVSGNTNAATIMIAEKGASLILADAIG